MPRPPRPLCDCPTCGRTFARLELHTVCPLDPAVQAWLAQHLPDPANRRYIIAMKNLDSLHPPIGRVPLVRHYGSWHKVAAAFGLRSWVRQHGDTAQLDPTELAELHRLANELHGGRIGPSHGEYGVFARDVPRKETGLVKAFGTWANVLLAAGLPYGCRGDYINASNARRRNHQAPQNERHSFDRGDEAISRDYTGIPVFPNPRPLKSGGVAWTVR